MLSFEFDPKKSRHVLHFTGDFECRPGVVDKVCPDKT